MGWRERDYARWTPEERRRFLGIGPSWRASLSSAVTLAVVVSALLYVLGHFPRSHPILRALPFDLSAINVTSGGRRSTPNVPETHARVRLRSEVVPVQSFLTFRGPVPVGDNGPVIIRGSLNGGPWRTLAVADANSGKYLTRIALNHRGKLRLRIVFRDGTEAVETVTVR